MCELDYFECSYLDYFKTIFILTYYSVFFLFSVVGSIFLFVSIPALICAIVMLPVRITKDIFILVFKLIIWMEKKYKTYKKKV